MVKAILIALVGLTAQLQAPSAAQTTQLESGIQAYETQEYAKAVQLLEPLATDGVTEAQYFIGVMHWYGTGFEMDPKAAQQWFGKCYASWRQSADAGDLDAMVEVSLMFRNGFGVERDDKESFKWVQRALEKNPEFVRAVSLMGDHYLDGMGVAQNREQAIIWYRHAADLGDAWGIMMVGRLAP